MKTQLPLFARAMLLVGCAVLPATAFADPPTATSPGATPTSATPAAATPTGATPTGASTESAPPAASAGVHAQASVTPPMITKPLPPAPPIERRITAPIIVSGALAGAALVNGVVFAVMAAGDKSSYDKKPDHQVGVSGERNSFIADVSFSVAALFGLTAIAMYFLPDEPTPGATAARNTKPVASSTRWVKSALTGEVLRF